MPLPKAYTPKEHEDDIYEKWESSGFFNPDNLDTDDGAPSFVISMPPPNATGVLHVGHTLGITVQDIMTRYHRMKGERAMMVPGTDHAAIATQNVVEKMLRKEGSSRHKLGREKFLERTQEYVEQNKSTINNQTRKMGASADWSREGYTMSDELSRTVAMQFKNMYEDNLIYQGDRVVNWCPRCQSTLADDEVEHKAQKGKLYWIKYGPFILATTRPETKLGDTAVAVHPDDERYQNMIGQKYIIPGVLGEFEIIVISDRAVDPEFGSGAVKVTPSHSFADADMAGRNGIKGKKIIDEKGRMMDNCGKYAGMKTSEAREAIVSDMQKMGLIDHIDEDYDINLSICYRCGTAIEPIPSKQWFVAVDKKFTIKNPDLIKSFGDKEATLKELALWAVNSEHIKIVPERFKKVYLNWIENLHDWCISRQIWFGHRIPVYYRKQGDSKSKCQMPNQAQSPNVKNKNSVDITYFVHGTTNDNEEKKSTGWNQGILSDLGVEQNLDLKEKIKERGDKYDVIICSDLDRAYETAKTIFPDAEIITDERLRECNYGDLNGHEHKEFNSDKYYYIENNHPNGENYKDVENRIKNLLDELLEKYPDKKIALIAHKYPQLAIDVIVNNKTWKQAIDADWRNTGSWQPGWKYSYGETQSSDEEIYVGLNAPEGEGWEQDPDTLDTWFSSALWTWSTLLDKKDFEKYETLEDWLRNSPDIAKFHPTSVMETMHDILFFWVARMIIMTLYALGEVPFKNVYMHGMVQDKNGNKMSKSHPETCIEPIEVSEKYGTDALRLSMVIGNTAGNNLRLSEQKIASFRNFANKLWNIGRFIDFQADGNNFESGTEFTPDTLASQWILCRLNEVVGEVTEDLDNYRFSLAGEKLYDFTWHELADWYIEIAKIESSQNTFNLLNHVYITLLKLLHPFTPFVTEKIYESFGDDKMLMVESWPEASDEYINVQVKEDFTLLQEIITAIRAHRKEKKVEPKEIIDITIAGAEDLIKNNTEILSTLAKVYLRQSPELARVDLEVGNLKIMVGEG